MPPRASSDSSWLNRNVIGMSIASLLGDMGYEMVTAVLPGFLSTIGAAAGALGWIEGLADAGSSFLKLGSGWYSDRIGRRKPIVTLGYCVSGTALVVFAWAVSWPLVLAGRMVAWLGRGVRGPLRDAMLADSVHPQARGKAFGFHRAGDTIGAVIGPLIGVFLLAHLPASPPSAPFRAIFLVSLIPGIGSAVAFALLVREIRRPARIGFRFWGALRELPAPYIRFLGGVGLFGLGDFSHTLLILAAIQLLTPRYGTVRAAEIGALLYLLRNVLYAGASFPIGALGDRLDKQKLLAAGYAVGVITAFGTAAAFAWQKTGIGTLAVLFALAGIYIASEDALEGIIPPELTSRSTRGTTYGLMGTVNGIGDLVASALVGTVWTVVSPAVAFTCAGFIMLAGAALVLWNRMAAGS
jgi:MFS family permease